MRNGLNIAGVSELVHEVQADPVEARYRYGAWARLRPGRGLTGGNLPAVLGTVKSPRRFDLAIAPDTTDSDATNPEPDPVDLALVSLGACALTTFLGGASSRGVTFERLRLDTSARQYGEPVSGGVEGIGYRVTANATTADGAPPGEVLAETLAGTEAQSPNHRSVCEPLPLTLDLDGRSTPAPLPVVPAADAEVRAVGRGVEWVYGTQFRAEPPEGSGQEPLRVDQAKQMGGVDWGANPQEYLLLALASCVLRQIRALTAGTEHGWLAHATGWVDVRGLLRISEDAPTAMQDLRCGVRPADGDPGPPDWPELVVAAVRRSPVAALLTGAHEVDARLEVRYAG